MYNDSIIVANKIITEEDLREIFQKMNDELQENIRIFKQETIQNQRFERNYQKWTVKDFNGTFRCAFDFYDSTSITVDNYPAFLAVFQNRLGEIKRMDVANYYHYSTMENGNSTYISQRIDLHIQEHKMTIDVDLSSADDKMNAIYQLIKEKVQNSKERYDRVIKKKTWISGKIAFALGIIPSLIIGVLLAFIPEVRELYSAGYVLFPIGVLILTFLIGNTLFGNTLGKLYSTIVPKQKYAGWDSVNGKSVYKDDMDDFLSTSEIIIGKNIDNVKNREQIIRLEEKYNKWIPIELAVFAVLSIVMIFIGR